MSRDFEVRKTAQQKRPIEVLIEERKLDFAQKLQYELDTKLIHVVMRSNQPFGIHHFGDPHLDDDGTDIGRVERDANLVVENEGVYAANVGDATNNWVGRLAALYAEQSTSRSDALRLNEWFVKKVGRKWLYAVGGNHDVWNGQGPLLSWIHEQEDALFQESAARIALDFPNGQQIRINCRHDFAGSSIYNPVHGPMKALTWGTRDHLAIAGHLHISGYGVLKDPQEEIAMHAVRVGSYKKFDRYAKERGFRDQMLGPSVFTVINPLLPPTHPDQIKIFWETEYGLDFLKFLRAQK